MLVFSRTVEIEASTPSRAHALGRGLDATPATHPDGGFCYNAARSP